MRQIGRAGVFLALGLCGLARCARDSATSRPPEPLTRIADIRKLGLDEALAGRPVLITGVVSAFEPALQVLTVTDDTAGILIDLPAGDRRIARGQRVEVQGWTGEEGGHRLVTRPTLRVIGEGRIAPPSRVSTADVFSGRVDDQWVQVAAELTAVERGSDGRMLLRLLLDGRPARALFDFELTPIEPFVGRRIVVNTVVNNVYSPDGRLARTDLLLGAASEIRDSEGRQPPRPEAPPQAGEPLTRIADVRALTPREAALPRRVSLAGTVTFAHARRSLAFLQDETGAVYIPPASIDPSKLESGYRVVVQGTTGPGGFSTLVNPTRWEVVGSGPLPRPQVVEEARLGEPALDAAWIEVEGFVRGVSRFDFEIASLRLRIGLSSFEALVPGFQDRPLPDELVGARVRVRGVCGTRYDRLRRLTGHQLLVPSIRDVRLVSPRIQDPFTQPVCPLGRLLQTGSPGSGEAVRVHGVVTLRRPDGRFYVGDSDGGALVDPLGEAEVSTGDEVDVAGYLPAHELVPVIEDALVRKSSAVAPLDPTAIEAEQGRTMDWSGRLVRIEAYLVDNRSSRGERVLLLESGRIRLMAVLEQPQGDGALAGLQPGSLVAVTGVRALQPARTSSVAQSHLYELLLRTPRDVTLLRAATWWTRRRTLGVLGAMSAVALLAVGWLVVLGRRVAAQTAEIRRQLEREAAFETRLRESSRLEDLGRLAGGVAHHFNNLLMVIGGNAELAARCAPDDHPARPRLERIRVAVARAASLTSQLLAFSRKQLVNPRVVEVNATVREAVETLQPLVGGAIVIETRLDPEAGEVRVDPGQLDQVFFNLAANARDAMPSGGVLRIETRRLEREAEPERGPWVRITFEDEGEGMAEEALRQAFRPFFSTKPPGKGTGLGLAGVQGIVEQSGGRVSLTSTLGKGTAVFVDLPNVSEAVPMESAPPAVATAVQDAPVRVLLVEDDREIREALASVLASAGFAVVQAASGAEAIRRLESREPAIDVLVTDVAMRPPNGRAVAERARSLHPGLPVVYMSGYADSVLAADDLSRADTVFLQKPFLPERLTSTLRSLVGALV